MKEEFSEEDFKDTRTSFTLALENVLGEEGPICLPIIYISVNDTTTEVLHQIKSARRTEVCHKATSTIPNILYNLSRCTYDYRGRITITDSSAWRAGEKNLIMAAAYHVLLLAM